MSAQSIVRDATRDGRRRTSDGRVVGGQGGNRMAVLQYLAIWIGAEMDNYSKLCDESQLAGPTFGDVKLGGIPSNDTEISLSARAPRVVGPFHFETLCQVLELLPCRAE